MVCCFIVQEVISQFAAISLCFYMASVVIHSDIQASFRLVFGLRLRLRHPRSHLEICEARVTASARSAQENVNFPFPCVCVCVVTCTLALTG